MVYEATGQLFLDISIHDYLRMTNVICVRKQHIQCDALQRSCSYHCGRTQKLQKCKIIPREIEENDCSILDCYRWLPMNTRNVTQRRVVEFSMGFTPFVCAKIDSRRVSVTAIILSDACN